MHERAAREHVMSEPRARAARADRIATFRSLGAAEVAADFTFCHRSSDQDCLEIAPNDADGLVTSRRYGYRTLDTIRGVENGMIIST